MKHWKLHTKEMFIIIITAVVISFGLVVSFLKYTEAGTIVSKKLNCLHFASERYPKEAVAKALPDNPQLDRDGDGIGCEMYK